jgi:hypothetical protein
MLVGFGVPVLRDGLAVRLRGPARLTGTALRVPGDLSSAAFFLVAAALVAVALPCAADIPIRSPYYNNSKFQFSVEIPDHLVGCESENTDDGIAIPLDDHTGCKSVTDHPPYATVYGSYNVATGVKTAKALAQLYCRGPDVRRAVPLQNWTLGGRAAAGCRLYLDRDGIELKLMTLRKTDPQASEAWIEVGAYLSTTASRYDHDIREFRKIVRTVRIAPDGPQK